MTEKVFGIAGAAVELALLCSSMPWHPNAAEILWTMILVAVAAIEWLMRERG